MDAVKRKRRKRSGNPHIAFRLERDLAEYLKSRPEGVRAYLTQLIENDKRISESEANREEVLRQLFDGFVEDER